MISMEEINFSKKLKEKFEFELAKYPEDQRISAVMASLTCSRRVWWLPYG